jgi:hypothetical protein
VIQQTKLQIFGPSAVSRAPAKNTGLKKLWDIKNYAICCCAHVGYEGAYGYRGTHGRICKNFTSARPIYL